MLNRIKTEPVLVTTLARALILCVTAFGLKLSADQVAGIMLVLEAVLGFVTRASVTPVPVLRDEDGAFDPGSAAIGALVGATVAYLIFIR